MELIDDKIVGERVYLREMTEEDALHVVKWRNHPEIKRWMFNQDDITIEGHLKWFRNRNNNRIDFIVCDKISDEPIGTVNFTVDNNHVAESGRLIGNTSYWGKGYAKEAALLWLEFGFLHLNLKKVIAVTKCENKPNIGLNEKIGFKIVEKSVFEKDRVNHNVYIMELKKEDFYVH